MRVTDNEPKNREAKPLTIKEMIVNYCAEHGAIIVSTTYRTPEENEKIINSGSKNTKSLHLTLSASNI